MLHNLGLPDGASLTAPQTTGYDSGEADMNPEVGARGEGGVVADLRRRFASWVHYGIQFEWHDLIGGRHEV